MRDTGTIAVATGRLRTAMEHLAAPGQWEVREGYLHLRGGETRVKVTYDGMSQSIEICVDGDTADRLACMRHILPTETQLELAGRVPTPASLLALLAPMVRIAEIATHREPSSIPMDGEALEAMCSRMSSACLAEGHVVDSIDVRPWTDGMTKMTAHLREGGAVEPSPTVLALLTEHWATSVEIDMHGYASTHTRKSMKPPTHEEGLYLTVCPQGGMYVEGVEADVVTAMRWAAAPPAAKPMFSQPKPEANPMDGIWD